MKKLLTFVFSLLLLTQFTACESDSNSNKSSSTNYSEKNMVVTGVSRDVIDGQPGDLYQYTGDSWRVTVTPSTKIYVQRESCSGLSSGNPSDVRLGMTIFYRFNPEEATYEGTPNIARATKIEAYLPDCIADESGAGIQVITNTTTETVAVTKTTVTTNIVRR